MRFQCCIALLWLLFSLQKHVSARAGIVGESLQCKRSDAAIFPMREKKTHRRLLALVTVSEKVAVVAAAPVSAAPAAASAAASAPAAAAPVVVWFVQSGMNWIKVSE